MEGDYGGATMEGDYGGVIWRGDYGEVTMERKLWRRLDYGRTTIEGLGLWRATMKGLDYGGATMEEGNHLLFWGRFFSDCRPSWKSYSDEHFR